MADLNHVDYTENLFQAIDTIVANRIRQQQLDNTAIATIINNKKANLGQYIVTENNQFQYIATSSCNLYQVGDQVYILKMVNGNNLILDVIHQQPLSLITNYTNDLQNKLQLTRAHGQFKDIDYINTSLPLAYNDKRIIKGYVMDSFPYWRTALIDENIVLSSLSTKFENIKIEGQFTNGTSFSESIYLPSPVPIKELTLTGSSSTSAAYQINGAHLVNNVGIQFLITSAKEEAINSYLPSSLSLQLQLMAQKASIQSQLPTTRDFGQSADALGEKSPIKIAQTYLNQRTESGEHRFIYSTHNWLNNSGDTSTETPNKYDRQVNNSSGRGRIACDTFITLLLRGIRYKQSPYWDSETDKPTPANYEFEETDLDANGGWNQNHYLWVERLNNILISKDSTPAKQYFNRNLYYAFDLAWAMWYTGAVFSDKTQIRSGDLAFWSNALDQRDYFDNITHIAMVSVENEVPYLYEATSNTKYGEGIQKIKLTDKIPQPTYFGRINYNN